MQSPVRAEYEEVDLAGLAILARVSKTSRFKALPSPLDLDYPPDLQLFSLAFVMMYHLPTPKETGVNENTEAPTVLSESLLSSELPPESTPPKHNLRWIFMGKNVIRAGWAIVLFLITTAAAGLVLGFIMPRNMQPTRTATIPMSPRTVLINEGTGALYMVIATAVMALIERRSLFAYGYQGTARAVRFFSGLFWGFVAISAIVLTLWRAGFLVFDGQQLHGTAAWKYAALWGAAFLLVGIFEESLWRGYMQFTMTRGVGFWWGALLFSFLFGFSHQGLPGESPVGLVSAGVFGLILCLSLWYTGSLYWAVGFHAALGWGEGFFFGRAEPDSWFQGHLFGTHPVGKVLWSGGASGPTGSLITIPLVIIMAVFMWLWWRRRVESPFTGSGWRPAWSRKTRHLGKMAATR
jgi:membrane protease YdiL (CAAX protease family)